MANPLFAMTLLGTLVLAALAPAGAAAPVPDLFLVPPGETVHADALRAGHVVVAGTLILAKAAVHAKSLEVLDGGRIETLPGARGTPAAGESAAAHAGQAGADLVIKAKRVTLAADAWIVAGSGGAGGPAVALAHAIGGAGGKGGSVAIHARHLDLQGHVLPGAGGAGGHAMSLGQAPASSAEGGAGGDSGRVVVNGVETLVNWAYAPAHATAEAAPLACPALVNVDCNPDTRKLMETLRRFIDPPSLPDCGLGGKVETQAMAYDCGSIANETKDRVLKARESADALIRNARDCLDTLADPRTVLASSLSAASPVLTMDACSYADGLLDQVGPLVADARRTVDDAKRTVADLAASCNPNLNALAVPWTSCNGMVGVLVQDALASVSPGLPGLPGLVSAECAQPQGTPGKTNPLGTGGRGGDACVSMTGDDGEGGKNGKSGIFGCSNGGPGGPGASVGGAVANGGPGGHGMSGGAGGSATAITEGGDGGAGGNGGTRWGDPDCAGGPGGAGGNAGDASANGGAGGHGYCGSGGDGGGATAESRPGSGGRGGSGTPPGVLGPPGVGGVATATAGSAGLGADVC